MTTHNLGYMFGLRGAKQQTERPGKTNEEKFATGQGGKRAPQQRMAGNALTADIRQSIGLPQAFTLPPIGLAELRTPDLPQ